jgi:anthranilate phosphoribosyltransferase
MTLTDTQILERLMARHDIAHPDMRALMQRIMSGATSAPMIAAVAIALRMKKESVDEITAAAEVMRALATPVVLPALDHLVDLCGTGGDGLHTFNISTAAMFVAAAGGAQVAKHGGRSVSSSSGSADVLEAMGAQIQLSPAQVAQCLAQTGIGFMFAPNHHAAMQYAAPVRKALGVRSFFNLLGPLTNPAQAPHQLMGVFHPDLVPLQAQVLARLGSRRAMVVHGVADGLDEISLSGPTLVGELRQGRVTETTLHPSDLGLPTYPTSALHAPDARASLACIERALADEAGPLRDIVLANAGAALYCAHRAPSLLEGVQLARSLITSGQARAKRDQFVAATRSLVPGVTP